MFDSKRFDSFMTGQDSMKQASLSLQSNDGSESMQISSQSQLMKEFMTIMSLAHEVVAEDPGQLSANDEDYETQDPHVLKFQGPSPDEVTLVEFARERGFCFMSSNDKFAKIRVAQSQIAQ